MHEDLLVDELVLLHDRQHHNLVKSIAADAKEISPQTQVSGHKVSIKILGILLKFMVHSMTL